MKTRMLLVEDDRDLADTLCLGLSRRGYECTWCAGADEALARLDEAPAEVVVTDLRLKGLDGLDLCQRINAGHPDVPVIVLTGFGSLDTAVAAIRAGAYDFLTKPVDVEALEVAVERAAQHRALTVEVARLRKAVSAPHGLEGMVGESPAMRRVFDLVERVADTGASVLITGETGTGKELVAQAIHSRSGRAQGNFVPVNCAALPENLLESELFGHVRGAFTGAGDTREGLVARASGGTLFLDEIGEMPVGLQPKLLRVLQEKRMRPVGSDTERSVDVRIVAATNRDLEADVKAGRFREDLFFRLNVVQMELPPLRARGDDVLLLAQRFLERAAAAANRPVTGLASAAADRLLAYDWPGNVRELENCIERAVILARYNRITVDDLPAKVRGVALTVRPGGDDGAEVELVPLEVVERRHVLAVLEAVGGQRTRAAEILGVDRKTLYRKLERWQAHE